MLGILKRDAADSSSAVKQVRNHEWNLDGVEVILEERGRERAFRLVTQNQVLFEHLYVPKSRGLFRRFDPTYDSFDEEQEDFFLWTTRVASGAVDLPASK